MLEQIETIQRRLNLYTRVPKWFRDVDANFWSKILMFAKLCQEQLLKVAIHRLMNPISIISMIRPNRFPKNDFAGGLFNIFGMNSPPSQNHPGLTFHFEPSMKLHMIPKIPHISKIKRNAHETST